jgi:hypothetical protein
MSRRCVRCRGKVLFPTYEAGIAAAIRVSRSTNRGLRVFACPVGTGWHLSRFAADPALQRRPS